MSLISRCFSSPTSILAPSLTPTFATGAATHVSASAALEVTASVPPFGIVLSQEKHPDALKRLAALKTEKHRLYPNPDFKAAKLPELDFSVQEVCDAFNAKLAAKAMSAPCLTGSSASHVLEGGQYNNVKVCYACTYPGAEREQVVRELVQIVEQILIPLISAKLVSTGYSYTAAQIKDYYLHDKVFINGGDLWSWYGLGSIEVKVIFQASRHNVSLNDGICVSLANDLPVVYCIDPNGMAVDETVYQKARESRAARIMEIPQPENVFELFFKCILALSYGVKLQSSDIEYALERFKTDFPLSKYDERHLKKIRSFFRRRWHEVPQMFTFLEACLQLRKLKHDAERHDYYQLFAKAWLTRKDVDDTMPYPLRSLALLMKKFPHKTEQLIDFLQGILFYEWIAGNPAVGAYAFPFEADRSTPRFNFSLTHAKGTHYLSLLQSPDLLALDFLNNWESLEGAFVNEDDKALFANIFSELGFDTRLSAQANKQGVMQEVIEAFDKSPLAPILKEQYQGTINASRLLPFCISRLDEGVFKKKLQKEIVKICLQKSLQLWRNLHDSEVVVVIQALQSCVNDAKAENVTLFCLVWEKLSTDKKAQIIADPAFVEAFTSCFSQMVATLEQDPKPTSLKQLRDICGLLSHAKTSEFDAESLAAQVLPVVAKLAAKTKDPIAHSTAYQALRAFSSFMKSDVHKQKYHEAFQNLLAQSMKANDPKMLVAAVLGAKHVLYDVVSLDAKSIQLFLQVIQRCFNAGKVEQGQKLVDFIISKQCEPDADHRQSVLMQMKALLETQAITEVQLVFSGWRALLLQLGGLDETVKAQLLNLDFATKPSSALRQFILIASQLDSSSPMSNIYLSLKRKLNDKDSWYVRYELIKAHIAKATPQHLDCANELYSEGLLNTTQEGDFVYAFKLLMKLEIIKGMLNIVQMSPANKAKYENDLNVMLKEFITLLIQQQGKRPPKVEVISPVIAEVVTALTSYSMAKAKDLFQNVHKNKLLIPEHESQLLCLFIGSYAHNPQSMYSDRKLPLELLDQENDLHNKPQVIEALLQALTKMVQSDLSSRYELATDLFQKMIQRTSELKVLNPATLAGYYEFILAALQTNIKEASLLAVDAFKKVLSYDPMTTEQPQRTEACRSLMQQIQSQPGQHDDRKYNALIEFMVEKQIFQNLSLEDNLPFVLFLVKHINSSKLVGLLPRIEQNAFKGIDNHPEIILALLERLSRTGEKELFDAIKGKSMTSPLPFSGLGLSNRQQMRCIHYAVQHILKVVSEHKDEDTRKLKEYSDFFGQGQAGLEEFLAISESPQADLKFFMNSWCQINALAGDAQQFELSCEAFIAPDVLEMNATTEAMGVSLDGRLCCNAILEGVWRIPADQRAEFFKSQLFQILIEKIIKERTYKIHADGAEKLLSFFGRLYTEQALPVTDLNQYVLGYLKAESSHGKKLSSERKQNVVVLVEQMIKAAADVEDFNVLASLDDKFCCGAFLEGVWRIPADKRAGVLKSEAFKTLLVKIIRQRVYNIHSDGAEKLLSFFRRLYSEKALSVGDINKCVLEYLNTESSDKKELSHERNRNVVTLVEQMIKATSDIEDFEEITPLTLYLKKILPLKDVSHCQSKVEALIRHHLNSFEAYKPRNFLALLHAIRHLHKLAVLAAALETSKLRQTVYTVFQRSKPYLLDCIDPFCGLLHTLEQRGVYEIDNIPSHECEAVMGAKGEMDLFCVGLIGNSKQRRLVVPLMQRIHNIYFNPTILKKSPHLALQQYTHIFDILMICALIEQQTDLLKALFHNMNIWKALKIESVDAQLDKVKAECVQKMLLYPLIFQLLDQEIAKLPRENEEHGLTAFRKVYETPEQASAIQTIKNTIIDKILANPVDRNPQREDLIPLVNQCITFALDQDPTDFERIINIKNSIRLGVLAQEITAAENGKEGATDLIVPVVFPKRMKLEAEATEAPAEIRINEFVSPDSELP